MAIRTPCGSAWRKVVLWANAGKYYEFARSGASLPGFSAGLRIATPRRYKLRILRPGFSGGKARSQPLRCIAFSGPHRCAPVPILHWFAMTCRRRGRGYVCKDVSAMDTLGRGRGLPRLVAPKSAMSSPQSPPCPAPAKGQSRATLPWGSSPRKGCRGPMHRFAMTCRRQKRVCGCKGDFPAVHRQCPGMMGPRGKLLHVIARSEATWQSASPAAAQAKRNYSRRIRRSCGFALGIANLLGFPAGLRIATPVCALVRNDMQKHAA